MCLSIPQCSHGSHLCDLRDRRDPGCGPAPEEGRESRAWLGRALLPLPWVSRAPSPVPVSRGGQEEPGMSRDSASAARAAASLQTPGCFPTSPQLPSPLPPVPLPSRGQCHCSPCQPPTWGTPGTGRGSCRQRCKKRRPAEPGLRCGSCQGLSLTHLTLFLLCPHQQDRQRRGDGALWEGDVFPRWFYSKAFPKPAKVLPVKWRWHGQGTAGTVPGPRCWSRTKP